jgi:hypothetical protein
MACSPASHYLDGSSGALHPMRQWFATFFGVGDSNVVHSDPIAAPFRRIAARPPFGQVLPSSARHNGVSACIFA